MRRTYSERRPYGKRKEREDAAAGFTSPTAFKEHNYDHDVDNLKLSASVIYHNIKKLPKLQKDIRRKTEKQTSKYLEICKKDYNESLSSVLVSLKRIKEIVADEPEDTVGRSRRPGQCHACFQKDKDLMFMQAQNNSLQTEYDRIKRELTSERRDKQDALTRINRELTNERRDKQDALTRLSALTSSKLRDNNPNLTDLSDPNRPSKISEMFSELYDNEWTDAYDELSQTKDEVETIQHLNDMLVDAYDCCMRLSTPIRLFLDAKRTKIDSEFRQKVIGHIKRNARAVVIDLKKDLESEILRRCSVSNRTHKVLEYIDKSIEICWLMAIQDPPMYLYNAKTKEFDTAKFREYQRRGYYTEYVVWPALALCENGPLLSKGVAQGFDKHHVTRGNIPHNSKSTERSKQEENTSEKRLNQTWHHPSLNRAQDGHHGNSHKVLRTVPMER